MFSGKCMIPKKKKEKEIKKIKRGGKKEWKPCDVQWSLEILKVKIYSLASKNGGQNHQMEQPVCCNK